MDGLGARGWRRLRGPAVTVRRLKIPSRGRELQRHPVDAVAQACRRRTVREHVTEMSAALAAVHFGAGHEMTPVLGRADGPLERREETRPAGAALELSCRHKQRIAAAGALEGPGALLL